MLPPLLLLMTLLNHRLIASLCSQYTAVTQYCIFLTMLAHSRHHPKRATPGTAPRWRLSTNNFILPCHNKNYRWNMGGQPSASHISTKIYLCEIMSADMLYFDILVSTTLRPYITHWSYVDTIQWASAVGRVSDSANFRCTLIYTSHALPEILRTTLYLRSNSCFIQINNKLYNVYWTDLFLILSDFEYELRIINITIHWTVLTLHSTVTQQPHHMSSL